jgi:hypothetical protein
MSRRANSGGLGLSPNQVQENRQALESGILCEQNEFRRHLGEIFGRLGRIRFDAISKTELIHNVIRRLAWSWIAILFGHCTAPHVDNDDNRRIFSGRLPIAASRCLVEIVGRRPMTYCT